MLSDPVDLKVLPFTEIAVSIYLPEKTPASTVHFWAQHETYISGPGDFTAKADIPDATVKTSWYWLADVEVWTSGQTAATVTFGDSITDGVGAKQGDYSDWPDILASRLANQQSTAGLAVLNEGIGGNRILHDGAGVSALARLDRDVLAQPGVVNLIVLEGINDIGWPHMRPRLPNGGAPTEITDVARTFMTAFPDIQLFMDDVVFKDDTVEFHWTFTGTSSGPGGTGEWVRISGFEEWTFGYDDLVAESQGHYDQAEYDRQLEHGAPETQ